MRSCLVLLALACGLAVCTAQLSASAVTSTAAATSTATTATVSFASALGETATTSNSIDLPCFSQPCTCSGANSYVFTLPTITWSSPTTTCPAPAFSASGGQGTPTFKVTNNIGPTIYTASGFSSLSVPSFSVIASTTASSLSVDAPGTGFNAVALGSGLTSANSQATIQAADLKSGSSTAGFLIFNFTTANIVPINGKVIINLPYNYIYSLSGVTNPPSGTTFTSCAVSNTAASAAGICPATAAYGGISCTIATAILPVGANSIVFSTGWVQGPPAANAGSFTVTTQTSTLQTIDGPPASGSALQAFTSGTLNTVGNIVASNVTDLNAQVLPASTVNQLTFNFTTVNAVPIGGKIVLTTPTGFFQQLTLTQLTGGGATTLCGISVSSTTTDVVTCTISGARLAAAASIGAVSSAGNWGVKNNQVAGVFTVMTQTSNGFTIDAAVSGTTPAVSTVGIITPLAISSSSFTVTADMNPGLATTTGNLTIAVTSNVAIKVGGKLIFMLPFRFVTAASGAAYTINTAATSGTCTTTENPASAVCPTATPGTSTTTMTCTIAVADFPAVATSLILSPGTPWRIGSAMAAGTYTVQAVSANSGVITSISSTATTPAVGGTVGNTVASAIATAGDKLPGVTTAGTLPFGFTLAGALSIGSKITITLPAGYLSTAAGALSPVPQISTGTVACNFAKAVAAAPNACPPTAATPATIICTTGTTLVPAGVTTLTLAIGSWSLGKGASGSYTVNTGNNLGFPVDSVSSSATLTSATATGAVSAVGAAVFGSAGDQVPGLATTTGTLKFTFTTVTTLPAGSIVIVLQSGNYLTTTAGFATTMGSPSGVGPTGNCVLANNPQVCASTSTCGVVTPASPATQTLTCTFSTSLTAGVVTLSLNQGTYTVGSSQAASIYTVGTQNTAGTVVIDTASTTMGTLPALAAGAVSAAALAAFSVPGDMVPGTSTTGTLTFGFNTATDLPNMGIVVISLPVGYLASGPVSAKLGSNNINCVLDSGTMGACPGTAYQKLTCTTTAVAAKGVQSLALLGFVVGPKNTGTTYMVWTTSTASSSAVMIDTPASGALPAITTGGTASGVGTAAFSVPADRVPGATTTGSLTLQFTISTTLPKDTGRIIFSLSPKYLNTVTSTAASIAGSNPTPTSTCSSTAYTPGSNTGACAAPAVMDLITCTVGTAPLLPGTYSLVLTGGQWTVGGQQTVGAFSVKTTNSNVQLDTASTTNGILPAIGSTVTVTSFAITTPTDAAKVGIASSGTLTIGFTTSTNLPSTAFIMFALPSNYLSLLNGATMTGKDTTAPSCTLPSGGNLKCVFNNPLPAGQSVISLTAGWIPGTTVSAASFPTISNFNKGSYTVSNLITPPVYTPALSTSNFFVRFSSSECSTSLSYPQIGSTPGGSTPGASSGQSLLLSALVILSSIVLLL